MSIPENHKKFSFPKEERLRSYNYTQRLFAEGKSVQSYPLRMLYLPCDELSVSQIMVSVPKRYIKKAVHRNRIKRLMRENYRLMKHDLPFFKEKTHLIAFIYISKEIPDFTLITEKMKNCAKRWNEQQTSAIILPSTQTINV